MRLVQLDEVLTRGKGTNEEGKAILSRLIGRTLGEVTVEELLTARAAAQTDDVYIGATAVEGPEMRLREIYTEDEEE